jgi:hypothetical protein
VWAAVAVATALAADAGPLAPDGGAPPRGLSCLPTWYAGTVTFRPDAGWGLELADALFVPWERHGSASSWEEAVDGGTGMDLSAPTLASLYHAPYVTGAIRPIDTADAGPLEDPGRVRVEELLKVTYGHTREEVAGELTKVRFFGLRYPFHRLAAPALERVVERLGPAVKENPKLRPFLTSIGGTWSWRRIARSKNLSAHAWGIAIDLNADRAHYWRWTRRGELLVWRNSVPQAIVDAFEAEGFIWGGRWQHFDTMHFEYRPELLSDDCREGPPPPEANRIRTRSPG